MMQWGCNQGELLLQRRPAPKLIAGFFVDHLSESRIQVGDDSADRGQAALVDIVDPMIQRLGPAGGDM